MSIRYSILIVEDNQKYALRLKKLLGISYSVEIAYTVSEFRKKFAPYKYDLIMLDIRLEKDKEGIDVLREIKKQNPLIPVVMMTYYPDADTAVEALKLGANDYIQKEKVDDNFIFKTVTSILKERELSRKLQNLSRRVSYAEEPLTIIGESRQIKEVKDKIKIAAEDGEITVLITGETGVGKEIVARNIHALGRRKDAPFVAYSIAAAHADTIDSEIFGHEKGAFTGADTLRIGLVEEANKGILFLDEIGDLPESLQIKLLRLLENRTFRRLGGNNEIRVDVQFITATNRRLDEMIENSKFRKDLYFRLKAFEIFIPPLRERKDDIIPLAHYFIDIFKKRKSANVTKLSPEAENVLLNYDFPGNVRELKNMIERAIIIASARGMKEIRPEHLGINVKQLLNNQEVSDKNVTHTASITPTDFDTYDEYIAYSELQFLKRGIEKYGVTKKILAEKLGYPNRFTFQRRVKRIFSRYPHFKRHFPELYKLFNG